MPIRSRDMSDPIRVGWTDIQAGDTLTDGRKVMATDVRTSVTVCRLDDGTVLRVWRRGPGSSVEIASRHGARKAEQEARREVHQLADEAVKAVDTSALTMSPQTLWGTFVTALEGGIGYWSCAHVYQWKDANGEEDHTGFCAVIEIEDEDDLRTITAPVIEAGYLAIVERRVKVCDSIYKAIVLGWADVDGGGYVDADAADCIVQAGLFGEVVYG